MGDRDRLKEKLEHDHRKMQALKVLFSRALSVGFENNRFSEKQIESATGGRIDERKKKFGELDLREKELLVGKLLQMLENQLEVASD